MKINYNQLDDSKKQIQFTHGIYSLENNKSTKWIWSSTNFGGLINNVDYITLTVTSEVDNILYYDNNEMELKTDCLNVVKIKTSGKSEFEINLKDPYIVSGDNRTLGVKILSISIDNDVIF
jgi:hypothetical protein